MSSHYECYNNANMLNETYPLPVYSVFDHRKKSGKLDLLDNNDNFIVSSDLLQYILVLESQLHYTKIAVLESVSFKPCSRQA